MKTDPISTTEYTNFIQKLQLKELKLTSLNISVDEKFTPPATLTINDDSKYDNMENKHIKITIHYHLEAVKPNSNERGLTIDLTYVLLYRSDIPMTDEFFKIYKQGSLRVQTWPYFRQLVHQLTLEMHLPPLVLDTIKTPV